jgi:hypothetical protein
MSSFEHRYVKEGRNKEYWMEEKAFCRKGEAEKFITGR